LSGGVAGHTVGWQGTQLDGRAHSWMAGHTVGWQGTQLDGRAHSWMAGHTVGWQGTQSDGRAHSWMAGHTVGWQGTQLDGRAHSRLAGHTVGCRNGERKCGDCLPPSVQVTGARVLWCTGVAYQGAGKWARWVRRAPLCVGVECWQQGRSVQDIFYTFAVLLLGDDN
jgi:hypothetical protein